MSEKIEIVKKYEECFDDCRPIVYKGVTISPFLTKDIRLCNFACYCLLVDEIEFKDVSLMSLKRYDLIMTICERVMNKQFPQEEDVREKYDLMFQSFKLLLNNVFKSYTFDFSDPENPDRKRVLRVIDNEHQTYVIFNMKDFDNIRYLILEHNGVDYSLEQYPPKLRERLKLDLKKQQNKNKSKAPSIEKEIDGAFLYTHLPYEYLLNLPIRKFNNLISNIRDQEEYQILMSGNFIIKDEIKHWMSGGYENNVYKKLMSNSTEVENKFNKINS